MKIKLHNSLGKINKEYDIWFLFDEKMIFYLSGDFLRFRYQIDDWDFFLVFSSNTKEFEEWIGFGKNTKQKLNWCKDFGWNWEEMGN